ncbi:MAG: hypothetical protein ACTSYF_17695 [Promethearchaeota archaeon]
MPIDNVTTTMIITRTVPMIAIMLIMKAARFIEFGPSTFFALIANASPTGQNIKAKIKASIL